MDYSPSSSSVHGILQARMLKWVAMPSSRGASQLRNPTRDSCIAGRFFTMWATRELPTMQDTWVGSQGQKGLLEKGMATHSSNLAWRIPWTEEPGGLQVHGVAKSWTPLSDSDTFLLLKRNFRDPDMWFVKIFLLRWRVSYCVWALLQPKKRHTTYWDSWVLETTYSFGYAALANLLSNLGKKFVYIYI